MICDQVIGARVNVSVDDQDDRNYRVDFSKISNLIDYRPNVQDSGVVPHHGIDQI